MDLIKPVTNRGGLGHLYSTPLCRLLVMRHPGTCLRLMELRERLLTYLALLGITHSSAPYTGEAPY